MIARIRKVWRLTSWPERAVTCVSPAMPFLALRADGVTAAGAWVVAGLWWALYLSQKIENADLRLMVYVRELFHDSMIQALRAATTKHQRPQQSSSVRFPRVHR